MRDLIDKIKKEIQDRVKEDEKAISCNICTNMHDYGFRCGIVEGSKRDLEIIEDLLEKYLKEENLD